MFNVRLAGGHLYGRQLFTWLSLVVSLMASFVLSFFPLDVLDEIWDLIEPVSEGFLTYSFINVYSNRTWRNGCHGYTLHCLRSILYIILHGLILSVVDRKYIYTIHLYVSFRLGISFLSNRLNFFFS